MKILPPSKINAIKPTKGRKPTSILKGSGLYVITEKESKGDGCKRIVGQTQFQEEERVKLLTFH